MKPFACALVGVLLAAVTPGIGETTNYGDFPGAAASFLAVTEASVTDSLPLYGAPTVVGDSLSFSPTQFASAAAGGAADITAGTLNMTIQAAPGQSIATITVTELGDYLLTGQGTPATSAGVFGTLVVKDLATLDVLYQGLLVTPAALYALPGDAGGGVWSASATIDLAGQGTERISLTLDNILTTTSEPGTAALIEKKNVNGPSLIIRTPEPATVAVIGVGTFGLLRRRRRA